MITVPPLIFYFLGTLLMVCGPLRAYFFGWRIKDDPRVAEHDPELLAEQNRPRRTPAQQRHLMVGVVWFVMGIVLIVVTIQGELRARESRERAPILIRSAP